MAEKRYMAWLSFGYKHSVSKKKVTFSPQFWETCIYFCDNKKSLKIKSVIHSRGKQDSYDLHKQIKELGLKLQFSLVSAA